MQCPSCSSSTLRPIKLHSRLAARQCGKCNGVLIDLLNYREWAEVFNEGEPADIPVLDEVNDTTKALACPKCSRIMLKFRITGSTSNRVDVCSSCDEAWLDKGEWELLGSLRIQHKLNAVFTEPWQRNIREETANRAQEKKFKELLGSEEYEKLVRIKKWVSKHPNKADLVRYILKG